MLGGLPASYRSAALTSIIFLLRLSRLMNLLFPTFAQIFSHCGCSWSAYPWTLGLCRRIAARRCDTLACTSFACQLLAPILVNAAFSHTRLRPWALRIPVDTFSLVSLGPSPHHPRGSFFHHFPILFFRTIACFALHVHPAKASRKFVRLQLPLRFITWYPVDGLQSDCPWGQMKLSFAFCGRGGIWGHIRWVVGLEG